MKIFALKEESSDNSETVVYGWLTYFEEEKEFQIRLCEEIDYWECPIFFSPFVSPSMVCSSVSGWILSAKASSLVRS